MIKNILAKVAANKRAHKVVLNIGYVLSFICWITIPLLPTFGDKDGFIEKAIAISNNQNFFYDFKLADRHRDELIKLKPNDPNATIKYIQEVFTSFNMESYIQSFLVRMVTFGGDLSYEGYNIHGIYHSKRSEIGECNLISFDNNFWHKPDKSPLEIAFVLSYIEAMIRKHQELNTISRNIIFLGYDGRYKTQGKAVKEFLETYYNGGAVGFPRCGIIRQALNVEIDSETFNRLALIGPGLNSKISDYDFYSIYRENLNRHANGLWSIDDDMKTEKIIQRKLSEYYYPHAYQVAKLFDIVLPPIDMTYTLNTIKNYAFGRPNDAHSYFIERGIHAVTLKGYKCQSCAIKNDKEMLTSLGRTIETAHRSLMVLQEQFHRGSRMYMVLGHETVLMLKYVALILVIPIVVTLKAIKMHYGQKGDRRYRKVVTKHLGTLLSLFLVYITQDILKWGYQMYKGKELNLCNYIDNPDLEAYSEMIFGIYLALAAVIYGISSRVLPKVIRKILGENLNFDKYSFENWKSKHLFQTIYMGLGIIIWSISNIGLGLIGVYLIVPIFFFTRPVVEGKLKTYRNLFIILSWLGLVGWLLYYRYQNEPGMIIRDLRKLAMSQFCNSSDLFRFFVFYILPCFIFLKQTLLYKNYE